MLMEALVNGTNIFMRLRNGAERLPSPQAVADPEMNQIRYCPWGSKTTRQSCRVQYLCFSVFLFISGKEVITAVVKKYQKS